MSLIVKHFLHEHPVHFKCTIHYSSFDPLLLLQQWYSPFNADKEYLRILYLAATTMECEVETALNLLMQTEAMFSSDHVKELVCNQKQPVPAQQVPQVNLDEYNVLLDLKEVAS